MNDQYEYAERSLTPRIAQHLIIELFAEQTVQKQEIMRVVDETHIERGGLPAQARFHHPVTLALSKMKQEGRANNPNPGDGNWFIPSILPNGEGVDSENVSSEETDLDSARTIGSGEGSVYLYYFPAYKGLAEL